MNIEVLLKHWDLKELKNKKGELIMKLWHEGLLEKLPKQQLLGLHREICALREDGWGKKHSVVDYVFTNPYLKLVAYHMRVISEMERRGYEVDPEWKQHNYRGKVLGYDSYNGEDIASLQVYLKRFPVYSEHDEVYLEECLDNLKRKGVTI